MGALINTQGTAMSDIVDPNTATEVAAPRDTAVMPGFNSNSSWELAQRIGKAFASSTLVPQAYQGNLANCIVALEMANRMGASPLMVMQNLYIVHGNPGWSSKFLIASFNQSGKFSAMRYEWNEARTECRAWATEKATGERLIGPLVSVAMAKEEGWSTKSGSKWKTMPELMLMYRAAAFFVRTYAPEISMGLRTDDELIDTVEEVRPASSIAAVRAALTTTDAAASIAAKTLEQFSEDVDAAADEAAAQKVLDEAKPVLTPADFEALQQNFNMAWKA
jgi:hypothetical protein